MSEEQELLKTMQGYEFAVEKENFRYQWHTFCYNLIHETRFIPNQEDKKFIDEITELIIKYLTVELPIGSVFYRARIIPGAKLSVQKHYEDRETYKGRLPIWIPNKSRIKGYSKLSDVGIPPIDKAGSNRASPKGILYLYVTDNIYTAVSEVRPSILELVNVVEFVNQSPIKIIKIPRTGHDLKAMLVHDEVINLYLNEIARILSFEFSRPIRRGDADLEYLPTQYLVNAIRAKNSSIQGIAYPSFQGHVGMNFVIFSQDYLTLSEKPEKIIRVQNITYDCCNLNDLSESITPQQTSYNPTLTDKDIDEVKKQIVAQADYSNAIMPERNEET